MGLGVSLAVVPASQDLELGLAQRPQWEVPAGILVCVGRIYVWAASERVGCVAAMRQCADVLRRFRMD